MKAYVIHTLVEQSIKASDDCVASGEKHGLEINKFLGYTPNDKPISKCNSLGIPIDRFREKYSRLENCVAAFLSHHCLWRKCVEMDEEIVIFEHDAKIIDQIPVGVNYKGVLSIGAPSYGKFNTPPILGVNKLVSKQYLPGAHAYMVKPAAAKILVDSASKLAAPTDLYISNQNFPFVEEYYPWPVMCRDNFTTIQNEVGCYAKHRWSDSYKIL